MGASVPQGKRTEISRAMSEYRDMNASNPDTSSYSLSCSGPVVDSITESVDGSSDAAEYSAMLHITEHLDSCHIFEIHKAYEYWLSKSAKE
jgi:hypothetical protein